MTKKQQYWADKYIKNSITAKEAISKIQSGQRVFVGSSCGEPQALVLELIKNEHYFTGLEIIRIFSVDSSPFSFNSTEEVKETSFTIRSFYPGSARSRKINKIRRFLTPINLSTLPNLFKTKTIPIDVALIQVSPPDDFGWVSLGVSVDVTMAAAMYANLVIVQINPNMPRVLGRTFIHIDDIDYFVEHEEDIISIPSPPDLEEAKKIGKIVSHFIEDGSTIHTPPGLSLKALSEAFENKNDIGVHTEYMTDGIMNLVMRGNITNKFKGNKDGRIVASGAMGSKMLYEFLHENHSIDFQPSEYVNDPIIISRHNKMVSINTAISVDLTGQIAADAFSFNYFSGITGMYEFNKGALMAKDGKAIIILSATNPSKTTSRIVPFLENNAVIIPRTDVHYVATEFGVVNLFGKNFSERAKAMISIAHPDFREELFEKAKEQRLIDEKKTLKQSMKSIYPVSIEEEETINNVKVMFRPIKTVDERRLQEHYYGLRKEDVETRFFYEKKNFIHSDLEKTVEIDYVNNLTIVAVIGDFGFGQIIAVGEYYLNKQTGFVEIAFSVSKEWQGYGISKIMLRKLEKAAKERGFKGLTAFAYATNKRMINLFNNLPYKITTSYEDGIVTLNCKFDELKSKENNNE